MIGDKDLISIQQARILVENAQRAQRKLATFTQAQLDAIVEAMASAAEEQAQALAIMSHEESDCGLWQDKMAKNLFVCQEVRQSLRGMRCVGLLSGNEVEGVCEVGVPLGVIVALCPVTSPVSTTIYKTLLAIKSGNAIIFSPHPRARASIRHAIDIMVTAAHRAGLPEGAISCLDVVAKSGTEELMRHPGVSLLLVTGVLGMFPAARASGKPLIYGGTGNGPAFIERSADITQAVRDILASKTFDNGLAPSAEQCVIVDGCVEGETRAAFQNNGAHFMTEAEADALSGVLFHNNGARRRDMMGQSVATLARAAGFSVPASARVLVAERKYVSGQDPYLRELLAPVLAYYVEPDWMHACEKCVELLLRERHAQTLTIHSHDASVIGQFALKKPVARLLVNTGAAFGGMGMTTNLCPALTQGGGISGYGFTSDNISPMHLIYRRKIGYGVRTRTDADNRLEAVRTALRKVLGTHFSR